MELFETLQPNGGVFQGKSTFHASADEPPLTTIVVRLGDVRQISNPSIIQAERPFRGYGAGSALREDDCLRTALAEGMERYSCSVYSPEQFVRGCPAELPDPCLDLDTIPVCSERELANPKCPLVKPSKATSLRWVRGLCLENGQCVYVPAVMVYLHAGFVSSSEKIALPITTGCAAHISFEQAILSGIFELIERDAISMLWLQRIPFPRIEVDCLPPPLDIYWSAYQQSSRELEYVFFNATTDLGVPTVYGLQISRADKRVTTLVSCSSANTAAEAVAKVIRDMASCRIAFRQNRTCPMNYEDFHDVFHGAVYMARAENAGAFAFLLENRRRQLLSEIPSFNSENPKETLKRVLDTLQNKHMNVFAVDLTTDEAVRCGLRVVRILIPQLQPLSFWYRARYLGHPRLYEAPKRMGYHVYSEGDLNHQPQPFA
jgi:ribosomal protein S12 methylthiotransferase accessory factor